MRTISATLLAAQKSASAVPHVGVTVIDEVAGVTNLRWQRLYTGNEPDNHHAAAMPGDGSLLRAWLDPPIPTLRYQRAPNPDENTGFAGSSALGSTFDAGIALAASGTNALLTYRKAGSASLEVRESNNFGASWGLVQTIATSTHAWVAAMMKSNGDALIIYNPAGTGDVYAIKRVSSVWGAAALWSNSAAVGGITGLAVTHFGDWHVVITGSDAGGNHRVWTATFGDGFIQTIDTWSPLSEVEIADKDSSIDFHTPAITALDTHRLFYLEKNVGSVASSRPYASWFNPLQLFGANAWREPVPFDLEANFGPAVTGNIAHAWLTAPYGVWRAPYGATALDLSGDVIELEIELRRQGGRAQVVLRNDDARYSDLAGGSFAAIRPGADLAISPGFVTPAGQEISSGLTYSIERIEQTTEGGGATLVIHAADRWSLLEGWRARRQHSWAAGESTISQILTFVLGRAGLEKLAVGASITALTFKPAFTIHPGESGLGAVRRLLSMAPDVLVISRETATLSEPKPGDAVDYAYGTDHAVFRARVTTAALGSNRAQAFGDGRMAEAFDWPEIDDRHDQLRQVVDKNLDTDALAQDRAAVVLRQEALAVPRGEVVTPVNCGQEIYDVIALTDPHLSLVSAPFRVAGIDLRYTRKGKRPRYEQRLLLGRV
ncbi:MAG: hypothetical protein IH958_06045 [Chloroflexi bacterium]|nr:hypothetical protein [Chloroflexota bacterium]